MSIQYLISTICGVCLCVLTLSCGSDDTAPAIGITSPSEDASFEAGDVVDWIGVAADDRSLAHISFTSNLWTELDTCDISLEVSTLFYDYEKSLMIDLLTPDGDYVFTATCMDADLNTAEIEVNFSVITDLDPTISLITPSTDTIITRGDTLHVIGTAKDDILLTSLSISVDSLLVNIPISAYDSDTSHAYNIDIPIVDTAAFMTYLLEITLADSRGQMDTVTRSFTLR